MDDNQVRTLGLAGGGAALVVALALVFTGDDKAQTQPAVDPPAATTTVTTTPSVSATAPIPAVETAMSEGPPPIAVVKPSAPKASAVPQNPNLEFLVRFDQRHPMHRAHQLVQAGREGEAEDLVRATLRQRSEFAGLCFSRFTLGGSEVVLAHCTRVPRAQVTRTSDRWLRKIRSMRGVQYADANVIADVEGR